MIGHGDCKIGSKQEVIPCEWFPNIMDGCMYANFCTDGLPAQAWFLWRIAPLHR
jgi:hypothetical protein